MPSCRGVKTISLPTSEPLPASFAGREDSLSVGTLSPRAFFSDAVLVSLLDSALKNNPDVGIATQRIEMVRASLLGSKGAFLPSVEAVASAGADRFGDYTMNGVGNFDTNFSPNIDGNQRIPTRPTPDYFLGLRSAWEVDLWGKLRHRRKAAYTRWLASQQGRHLVVTSLVAEVARLYYELLALDSELAIIRQNIQLQERALELTRVQKEAGRVTQLAVQQFSAQLLNTQSLEGDALQRRVVVENGLNALLGRFPQAINGNQPLDGQTLPALIGVGIPSRSLARRPDVQMAELELRAAHLDVVAARAAFLPSLSLSAYAGVNAFRSSVLFDPASLAYGLLGGLSAPLLSQNRLKAEYNQSAAQNREAHYQYQKAVLTGFSEVVTGLRGIENYNRMAQLKGAEVTVLRQAVTTSNDLFSAGYASYLEVVTAQRSVLEAERSLIAIQKAQFLYVIDLYRSLGGGWQ